MAKKTNSSAAVAEVPMADAVRQAMIEVPVMGEPHAGYAARVIELRMTQGEAETLASVASAMKVHPAEALRRILQQIAHQ